MEKLLIDFKEKEFLSFISSLQNSIEDMQEVIQAYNSMKIEEFTQRDFTGLFFETETFIFEKIMKDKSGEFFGMKVNKRKFFDDYLEKPRGYLDLLNAIKLFQKKTLFKVSSYWEGHNYKSYLSFFSILENGKIEICLLY